MLSDQLAQAKAKGRQTEDYIATPYIKKNKTKQKKTWSNHLVQKGPGICSIDLWWQSAWGA